jgi:hypothetical protein
MPARGKVPAWEDGGYCVATLKCGAAMENVERTAVDMIRRYGTREAAIQQAHTYDVEAVTDDERAFWRAVLAELRSYGVAKAAE